MWANTIPDGGLTVVGMENDGGFSGCHKWSDDQCNAIEKSPHVYCSDAKITSKRVEVQTVDGIPSYVVLFRTRYREDKCVRTASGKAYIRRGDEKHELSEHEIRELEIDKRQIDMEKESVHLRFPEDFNPELVRRFIEGVRKVHQPSQEHSDIEVLHQRRLGTLKNGQFASDSERQATISELMPYLLGYGKVELRWAPGTLGTYQDAMGWVIRWLGDIPPGRVTQQDILLIKAQCSKRNIGPSRTRQHPRGLEGVSPLLPACRRA